MEYFNSIFLANVHSKEEGSELFNLVKNYYNHDHNTVVKAAIILLLPLSLPPRPITQCWTG